VIISTFAIGSSIYKYFSLDGKSSGLETSTLVHFCHFTSFNNSAEYLEYSERLSHNNKTL
jgi:hypothetical protein